MNNIILEKKRNLGTKLLNFKKRTQGKLFVCNKKFLLVFVQPNVFVSPKKKFMFLSQQQFFLTNQNFVRATEKFGRSNINQTKKLYLLI